MTVTLARYLAPPGASAPAAEAPPDLGPRYALGAVLGRGGSATVWAARDRATGSDVVVKRFATQSGGGDFYRELNALTRLRHPGVLRVLNLAEDTTGGRCLILEFCRGGSLRAALTPGLPWTADAAWGLARQLAAGLAYAHAAGLVHRDVKPENVLFVSPDRTEARLADFGLSRGARPDDGSLRPADGTPAYLAPEGFTGASSPAGDVYALGAVLYELLHGRAPFAGSVTELARQHLHDAPALCPRLPGLWAELLAGLLAKLPAARPTAADAARVLAGPAPVEVPRSWGRSLGVEAFGLVPRLGVGGRAEFVAVTAAGLFAAPADGVGATRPLLLAGLDHAASAPDGTLWLARGRRLERLAAGAAYPESVATLPESARALAADDDGVAVLCGDAVTAYRAAGPRLWAAGVGSDARLVACLPGGRVAVATVEADTHVTRYAAGGARLDTLTLPGECRQLGVWPGNSGRLYAVTDAGLWDIEGPGAVRPVPGGGSVERVTGSGGVLYGVTGAGAVLRLAVDSPATELARFPSPQHPNAFAAVGDRFAAVSVGPAGCRVVVVTGGVG